MVKVSRRSDGGKSIKMSFKNVRYGSQKTVSKHLKALDHGRRIFQLVEFGRSCNFVVDPVEDFFADFSYLGFGRVESGYHFTCGILRNIYGAFGSVNIPQYLLILRRIIVLV